MSMMLRLLMDWKLFTKIRNKRKRKSDLLTVEDAKAMSDQFRYAVVNNKSGLPCYLCKTRDDAKESIDDIRRYCCTSASYRIVDLWLE